MVLYQAPMYTIKALCKVCILFISMVFSVIYILQMGKLDLEELRFVLVSEL